MTWWRRQRRALIALAIAAAAMLAAAVWLDIVPSIQPTDRAIEAESTADIAGQTLTLGPTEWDEFKTPAGTRTLSIRLSSSGGSEATLCGQTTLTEIDSDRTWLSSRKGLDVPYDEGESSCLPEPSSYRILLTFLLPDDADGSFLLDIEGSDNDLARFRIDP